MSHEGNVQASDEEADAIRTLISQLVKRTKIDDAGKPAGPLRPQDIMVVAPYPMQVRRLREQLHADVPVASVDKFQGQEAEKVVIFSMCSSFGEYGSRGLAFILDQNRLNVAISRARTLAVVDTRRPMGAVPSTACRWSTTTWPLCSSTPSPTRTRCHPEGSKRHSSG